MQKIIKNKIIDKSYFKNIFKNIKNILRTFFSSPRHTFCSRE